MPAIVDPALLDQLDAPDPNAAPAQPGAPAPLTIHGSGPVTDPTLLQSLNSAPDDPTPAAPAQPSGWGDTLRGVGAGLVKGAAAVPGMVGDWTHYLGEELPAEGIAYGADKLGLLPPGKTAGDFVNAVTNDPVLNGPPSGALDSIGRATSLPTTSSIVGGAETAAGQAMPEPTTKAGQMAENVTAFVPGAIAGTGEAQTLMGSLKNMGQSALAYGVAPGVASEAAGQGASALLGPWADTPARMLGGGIGAAAGHVALSAAPPDRILSGATRGATDDQIAQARALQQQSAGIGISITPAEAVGQVTGGKTGLMNLQRHLEGLGESAPIMSDYFAQRPGQVDNAARNTFAQIAPYPNDPSQVAVAAQNEAEGALGDIRQDRTNATSKYYAAAAGDQVPQDRMAQVAQQLDGMIAAHPNNPELTKGLTDLRSQIVDQPGTPGTPAVPGQRVPVTNPQTGALIRYQQQPGTPAVPSTPETYLSSVPQLDEIYGGARDQYTGPPPLGQSGTDARAGKIAGQGIGLLNDALKDSSPMLAAGRQAHGIMTDRWVAPREAGPIGQISKTTDLQAQGNALYPANPNIGSQGETAEAVQRMPQTAPALTRNYLETRFNEATQDNMGGPNQWGGAKFAAQTLGNSQQAKNLDAGLGALPNASTVQPQMSALAEALKATGQRQQIGSKTAYNAHMDDMMEAGKPAGTIASLALSPEKALEFARDWYQQRQIGNNAESLAHTMTGAGGFDRLEAARAAIPPELYRSFVVNALLGRSALGAQAAQQGSSGPGQ